MSRPSRFARWVLSRGVPSLDREFVLGDLEEEFFRRGGGIAARVWLWRQAMALVSARGCRGSWALVRLLGREGVAQDLRLAVRLLIKDRGFTIAVLLTLSVCIGANTAMLSIVRSVVLRPLPFPTSDRLVLVYNSYPKGGAARSSASVPDYYDRKALPAFEQVAIYQREGRRIGDDQGVELVDTLQATPELLHMLGVRPVLGRLFTEADAQPYKNSLVLLSYDLWQRKFGGAPVVDRVIRINEGPFRIVGVLPPDFSFLTDDVDIVEPRAFSDAERADSTRHANAFQMVGLLKPEATIAMAQDQINALNASLAARFPDTARRVRESGYRTVVAPLRDDLVRDVKAMLYLLWGGVVFVLVIGCVNVANLIAVRATGRSREIATRHAIGGNFGQIGRQLVTEGVVLCAAGGALGILAGTWALRSIQALFLDQLPRGHEVTVDAAGVSVILAGALGIGVALGLLPVARLRRVNLNVELRQDTRSGTEAGRARGARTAMATTQFATAFVVLCGAGLLFASYEAETRLDIGFDPDRVSTVTVEVPKPYRTVPLEIQYVRRTVEALRALPDVRAAAATTFVPFSGRTDRSVVAAEGQRQIARPAAMRVSPGYFETMGLTLARGRDFDERDTAGGAAVVVVDERIAQTFWPGQDPVGRRLFRPTDPGHPVATPQTTFVTVVGTVNTSRMLAPRAEEIPPGIVFYPYEQNPSTTLTFIAKARTPADLAGTMTAVMRRTDPQVPTLQPRSMQTWIDRQFVGRRAPMMLGLMFAAAAWLLSAIGVYGVIAHGVAERRREFGIRIALGDTTTGIFRLVLGSGLRIVGAGLVLGLPGAYFLGHAMKSHLFHVAPTSPLVLLSVTFGLSLVAVAAGVVPAWRAARTDPASVLGR